MDIDSLNSLGSTVCILSTQRKTMTLPNRHHCNVQIDLIYLLEGLCILKIIRYNCDLLYRHQKHVHISLFHAQYGHNIIEL